MQNVIEKPLKMVPIRNKKLSQFAAVQNEKICETDEFEGTISTIWTENKSQIETKANFDTQSGTYMAKGTYSTNSVLINWDKNTSQIETRHKFDRSNGTYKFNEKNSTNTVQNGTYNTLWDMNITEIPSIENFDRASGIYKFDGTSSSKTAEINNFDTASRTNGCTDFSKKNGISTRDDWTHNNGNMDNQMCAPVDNYFGMNVTLHTDQWKSSNIDPFPTVDKFRLRNDTREHNRKSSSSGK